jgi:hypothetical protein
MAFSAIDEKGHWEAIFYDGCISAQRDTLMDFWADMVGCIYLE